MRATRFANSPDAKSRRFSKWVLLLVLCFALAAFLIPLSQARENGEFILFEGSVVTNPTLCANTFCHDSQAGSTLNQIGSVQFQNVPAEYVAGRSYELGLLIQGDSFTRVFGFQLAALFADNTQAGELEPITPGVRRFTSRGVAVLTHSPDPLQSGLVIFRWTAPQVPRGPVTLRVAANAANGNFSNSGDHINTASVTMAAAPASDLSLSAGETSMELSVGQELTYSLTVSNLGPDEATNVIVEDLLPSGVSLSSTQTSQGSCSSVTDDGRESVQCSLGSLAATNTVTLQFTAQALLPGPSSHTALVRTETNDPDSSNNAVMFQLNVQPQDATTFYFPQIGAGRSGAVEFFTELIFINAGADTSITIEFFGASGQPLLFIVDDTDAAVSRFSRSLQAGEAISLRLDSASGIQAGYARIVSSPQVGGTAVFCERDAPSGLVLYEAGVPATTPLQDFTLSVDSSPGTRDTGLALVNTREIPSSGATLAENEARVILRLYDPAFQLVDQIQLTLAAGAHLPRFVSDPDLFPGLGADFKGSLTVESDQPLAAVTLRQTTVPTLTAFPVVAGRADREP